MAPESCVLLSSFLNSVCKKWLRSVWVFKLILTSILQVIRTYPTVLKDIPLLVPYLQRGTRFPTEHVNMSQQTITEMREKNRDSLGPVLVLAVFMEHNSALHVVGSHLWRSSFPRVNLVEYCNSSLTSLMLCLTLTCIMIVLQPPSQKLLLKTRGASRNSSRDK